MCQRQECLLGDFMAYATLTYWRNLSLMADFALINAGGIRATIEVGPVTHGEMLTSFALGNAIVEITFSGDQLWNFLEKIVSGNSQFNGKEVTSFVQVSQGTKIEYDPENGDGLKLVNLCIAREPLDREANYQVVTLDFLAGGGDNFWEPITEFMTLDMQHEVLTRYIRSQSTVDIALDGRISIVNGTAGTAAAKNATKEAESGNGPGSRANGAGSSSVGTSALLLGLVTYFMALM